MKFTSDQICGIVRHLITALAGAGFVDPALVQSALPMLNPAWARILSFGMGYVATHWSVASNSPASLTVAADKAIQATAAQVRAASSGGFATFPVIILMLGALVLTTVFPVWMCGHPWAAAVLFVLGSVLLGFSLLERQRSNPGRYYAPHRYGGSRVGHGHAGQVTMPVLLLLSLCALGVLFTGCASNSTTLSREVTATNGVVTKTTTRYRVLALWPATQDIATYKAGNGTVQVVGESGAHQSTDSTNVASLIQAAATLGAAGLKFAP